MTLSFEKQLEVHGLVLGLIRSGNTAKAAEVKVANQMSLKPSHVHTLYHRIGRDVSRTHSNRMFMEEEEHVLLSILVTFSTIHHTLTPAQAREEVKLLFGKAVSAPTMKRFLKRHKDVLKVSKSKLLASKRSGMTTLHNVEEFCKRLQAVSERRKMMAANVINYDETRIFVGQGGKTVVERRDKRRSQRKGYKGRSIGSLVTFVSAAGQVLMSVWILKCAAEKNSGLMKANFSVPNEKHILRGSRPRYYAFTSTTYTNVEVHREIMSRFCQIWPNQNPGMHCFVFGDQLASHYDIEVVRNSLKMDVLVWSLPSNTSHFLQPLDDVCFARFKKGIHSVAFGVQLEGENTGDDVLDRLYSVAYEVEARIFTKRTIQRAFFNTLC